MSNCKRCNTFVPTRKNWDSKRNKYYEVQPKECNSCRFLMNKYGIDSLERDRMLKEQNGECLICSTELKFGRENNKLHCVVDHCHATGIVRGLLCNQCNVGLGNFRDNVRFLENAIEYLKERDYTGRSK